MAENQEKRDRCDADQIEVGSMWSRHSFGTVVRRTKRATFGGFGPPELNFHLRNEDGFEWTVSGREVMESEFSFADQHIAEAQETRTRLNEILLEHRGTAMTICFTKKPDPKRIAEELESGRGKLGVRAWRKRVKELLEGEERMMVGHHLGGFDQHQRLQFFESEKGLRLVDLRTIRWLVVDRTRYEVK